MSRSTSSDRKRLGATSRRLRGDQGAILVEFALFAPLAAVLILGMVEFGFIWRTENAVSNASLRSARTGATFGDIRWADFEALASLDAALGDVSSVKKVVIWRADSTSGGQWQPPSTCRNMTDSAGPQGSSAQRCNVYFPAEIQSYLAAGASAAGFGNATDTTCSGSAPDRFWCPTSREIELSGPPDYLGVWVEYDHDWFTGLLPGDGIIDVTDAAILRLEPVPTA